MFSGFREPAAASIAKQNLDADQGHFFVSNGSDYFNKNVRDFMR